MAEQRVRITRDAGQIGDSIRAARIVRKELEQSGWKNLVLVSVVKERLESPRWIVSFDADDPTK